MSHIYLDHNATTPPWPPALDAVRETALAVWANPASVHRPGQQARAHLERARREVGRLTGLPARDVILTAGGTEANNLALHAPFPPGREATAGALVTSRIEHPSVVGAAEALAARGVLVIWVDPDPEGTITAAAVTAAIEAARAEVVAAGGVALITAQAVGHETGTVQPIADLRTVADQWGAVLHVDAVQALGRLPPEVWTGADTVTLAGHKLRGPKGIGALATRAGFILRPVLRGGEQERGIRPGTQDAALAAGLAVAVARAADGGPGRYAALRRHRDRLEQALLELGHQLRVNVVVNGPPVDVRAPHVTNLSFAGWRSPELCASLDLEGVAVSSGSACSAGTAEPSPVVAAMAGAMRAASAVRISLGETTSDRDIDAAIEAFTRVLGRRGPPRA